jgi:hypothetical protein
LLIYFALWIGHNLWLIFSNFDRGRTYIAWFFIFICQAKLCCEIKHGVISQNENRISNEDEYVK